MMGLVLEQLRNYLRGQHTWDYTQCGVHFNAEPFPTAGQFFVSIDDDGVEQAGRPEDNFVTERYRIVIGVWRQQAPTAGDRRGLLQFPGDLYRENLETIEDLERKVFSVLHQKEALRVFLTVAAQAQPLEFGENEFVKPLWYSGRGRPEVSSPPEFAQTEPRMFLGRKLRFKGLDRVQQISELL